MSARGRGLNYYPAEFNSPMPGNTSPCDGGDSSNGAVVAASIVLIILIILVVIGGIVYWCRPNKYREGVVVTKGGQGSLRHVSYGEGQQRELEECSPDMLRQILTGQYDGTVVLAFVAPWCGHCNNMKPALKSAARRSECPVMTLTYESADKTPHVHKAAEAMQVKGFPMLTKVSPPGTDQTLKVTHYSGDRSEQSIVDFAVSEAN